MASKLKIICNTVWGLAVQVRVTDDVDNTPIDTDPYQNIVGGPPHLKYTQILGGANDDRRYVYINKSGNLTYDTVVVTNAARYNGYGVQLTDWTTYTAARNVVYNASPFAETLCGAHSRDWVKEIGSTRSSMQAVGIIVGGAFTKIMSQFYAGTAFTLNYNPEVTITPYWGSVTLYRQRYLVQERMDLFIQAMSRTELSTLKSLYRIAEEPFFIYDSDGLRIDTKLWHCVLGSLEASPIFDDKHDVKMTVYRLRPVD